MPIQKVLVVDDSKTELMFLTDLLQKKGMQVRTAENAEEAFRRLAEEKPDLILMDVQMPDMDGLQTCEYIRHQLGMKQLPILALTAGVMAADHQLAREAGMNEVLTKPLEIDKVLDAVQRWSTQLTVKARNTSHA